MIRPRHHYAIGALVMGLLAGCAPVEKIPTYPPMSTEQELQTLRARSHDIKDVSCQAMITLSQPGGQTVRFDAAVAMQPPARARIRAYKFGQAVFDLTVTPDGVWLIAPPDEHHDQIIAAGSSAAGFLREWLSLMTDPADGPNLHADDGANTLEVTTVQRDGASDLAQIDRKTLTVRKLLMKGAGGRVRFTLSFSHFITSSGIAWPTRIEGTSEAGVLLVEIQNAELNGGLPDLAFRPPARAEKLR